MLGLSWVGSGVCLSDNGEYSYQQSQIVAISKIWYHKIAQVALLVPKLPLRIDHLNN